MRYFIMVRKSDSRVTCGFSYPDDGPTPTPDDGCSVVEVLELPGECNPGQEIKHVLSRSNQDQFEAVPNPEKQWELLRRKRNQLLFDTDWTELPTVQSKFRDGYAAYRQALRDLPESTIDPANPVWPKMPAE
jgi:hypothetical protein